MNINYLFVAVLVLFAYMISRGYRLGFLRIAVTFIGMLFILAAVRKASPYFSDYLINNTDVYEAVQDKITEKFAEANRRYDNSIPENQNLTIRSYDIPDAMKDNLILNNTSEIYKALLVTVFEEYVSAYLAKTAIKALAFVILFIALYIVFRIVLRMVDIISRIPIIKGLNKAVGACLGLIEALIIVWVFFIIAIMFIGEDTGSTLLKMISESSFLTMLFNSNILMAVIS